MDSLEQIIKKNEAVSAERERVFPGSVSHNRPQRDLGDWMGFVAPATVPAIGELENRLLDR